uniref:Uncharacterized protein n=1 Tax=Meloidogyne enterolobii TaxID=390850 RepID=A0A6V7UAW1_MELEN|nr:unnamed protein product [Meloidogyne enterolobii]
MLNIKITQFILSDQKTLPNGAVFSQLYYLTSVENVMACVKYIAANRKKFLNSKEWMDFKAKNNDFAISLMELALKTQF